MHRYRKNGLDQLGLNYCDWQQLMELLWRSSGQPGQCIPQASLGADS